MKPQSLRALSLHAGLLTIGLIAATYGSRAPNNDSSLASSVAAEREKAAQVRIAAESSPLRMRITQADALRR